MAPIYNYMVDFFNVFGGITSTILGFLSIFISITFYIYGKKTETDTREALAEIKSQAEALQKLSGKHIDKLLDHTLGSSKNDSNSEITQQLLAILKSMPNALTSANDNSQHEGNDKQSIVTLHIALYFYTAQTNYWAQYYLPRLNEFEEQNSFHSFVKWVIDWSKNDYNVVANFLDNTDKEVLDHDPLVHLLKETDERWRHSVKSSAEAFISPLTGLKLQEPT